jgi:hypothetical protein
MHAPINFVRKRQQVVLFCSHLYPRLRQGGVQPQIAAAGAPIPPSILVFAQFVKKHPGVFLLALCCNTMAKILCMHFFRTKGPFFQLI